jgi:DNA-binding Lrp family transcriptional regulator
MEDWWSDIDNEILTTLATGGAMEPAEIARRLGVSEASVTSLIWALVSQGKIRVRLVEAAA